MRPYTIPLSVLNYKNKEYTALLNNFCPCCSFSANNTFPYPTGPTYSRIVAFAKPTQSRMGRFPSTLVVGIALVYKNTLAAFLGNLYSKGPTLTSMS
jgi:hypothetical protein